MKKIALILFIVLPVSLYSQWIKKTNFPDTRTFTIAFSIGKYGYVGGGILDQENVRDFWRYDAEADLWEPIDSIPVPRRSADAVSFVTNGKAYVCCPHGISRSVWEYDPISEKWTQKANTPSNSSQFKFTRTAFSIGNYGYLFLNNDLYPGSPNNDFFQYDPETDTWTEKATCPVNGIFGMVGFGLKGKGYIGTGQIRNTEEDQQFWKYDPELDQWERITDFPGTPRLGAVAFSIGDYGYVGSGSEKSDFWRYDPEDDSWEQVDSIGYSTSGAFAFTINGKGYVGGGTEIAEGEFWEYTPSILNSIDLHKTHSLNIYPNPAIETIHWNTSLKNISKIYLTNINGQVLMHFDSARDEINVSGLPDGIYLLRFKTNQQQFIRKIIVQNKP